MFNGIKYSFSSYLNRVHVYQYSTPYVLVSLQTEHSTHMNVGGHTANGTMAKTAATELLMASTRKSTAIDVPGA